MAEADPHAKIVADDNSPATAKTGRNRRYALLGITAAVLVAGAGYSGWYALVGSRRVSTDNAYVGRMSPRSP